AAGTYIMDGGDFSFTGTGSVTGTDVTIILTNSGGNSYGTYGNMDVHGNGSLSLAAPTTGDYAGMAVYQDRDTPGPCQNTFTGGSGLQVDGVFYTPSCGLDFGGTSAVTSAADVCTKLISKTITYHGTPTIGANCAGKGTKSIGAPAVRLII
ncbi:MAG: hypothetical protein HY052_02600, partial [Proteobacteria bacterium]|nr:hypothetical protein [Pseudomonadota bacterium]